MMAELIMKLRASPTTAAIFGERVTGAADYSRPQTYSSLSFPCAFVCPLSETANAQPPANENNQQVESLWGIVVALAATEDMRGQDPAQSIDAVRRAIWKACYNWSPNYATGGPHSPMAFKYGNIWYRSTTLLEVSTAASFWLITIGVHYGLCAGLHGETDQFEPPHTGKLERIHVFNDWIDPHDPGLPPSEDYGQPPVGPPRGPAPWPSGPEGRIEGEFRVELPQTQPSPRGHRNGPRTH